MDNITDVSQVHGGKHQPRVGGPVVRKLDPKTMPADEMNLLWQRVSTQDYAFDDFSRGNPQFFVLALTDLSSYHFMVDDSTWVLIRNVFKGSDCNIHFVCWDRLYPFGNLLEAGKQILEWLFKEQGVNRVTGYIPVYNHLAKRFATTMGFKYEGTLRKTCLFKGKYEDVDLYGLLAKEFERRHTQ